MFVPFLKTTLFNAFTSLVLLALVSLLDDGLKWLIRRARGCVQTSYLFNKPRTWATRDDKPSLKRRCAKASACIALFLGLQVTVTCMTTYLSHMLISNFADRQKRWQCRALYVRGRHCLWAVRIQVALQAVGILVLRLIIRKHEIEGTMRQGTLRNLLRMGLGVPGAVVRGQRKVVRTIGNVFRA